MKLRCMFWAIMLCAPLVQARDADFRVMSYNIQRGDRDTTKTWGWYNRKHAAVAMLQANHPDLIGTQECTSFQRDDILERLKDYKYIGKSVKGETGDYPETSSNIILYDTSTMEVIEDGQFWLAFDPDSVGMNTWMATKPRCVTWGHFRHKPTGREVFFFNNHLQNGAEFVVNRSMSILLLLAKMREINPEGAPMLYSGDLNSECKEEFFSPLLQEMKEAAFACPETDLDGTFGHHFRNDPAKSRIDHIFFSGPLKGVRYVVDRNAYDGVAYSSDHFPVYADFSFSSEPQKRENYWFDLTPDEGDHPIRVGTWNLYNEAERADHSAPSWNSVKASIAEVIDGMDVDIIGLQELTETMAQTLPKQLKAICGKRFKLWSAFSDPSPDNLRREAVGLLYNTERFTISRQTQSWIRSGDFAVPGKPWGDEYRSILSAVFTDKLTGKRFFVMTGKLCRGETPIKREGGAIKKMEAELNSEALPSILLVDLNTTPKDMVYLSLLNYWTDMYALQYPSGDPVFSTCVLTPNDETNFLKDRHGRRDIVAVKRYVDNSIIVTDHTVHREIRNLDLLPSDHYPVTSTFIFK